MHASKLSRIAALTAAFLLALYFWRFTSISLWTEFNQDDLMNLYFAWREPFSELLKANLFFRTSIVRPFGALFYVAGHQAWGFDGFPFRVVCYVILCLNVPVTYWFVRYATRSREIGLLATLLHCVHSCYFPLYYGSGSCYDVFAFFFYYLAFAIVVRVRSAGRILNLVECVGIAALFALAVNSKEAAATLPGLILIYELLHHPPRSLAWIWREGRAVLATGAITLLFLRARFTGPNNLLSHPAYSPVFTLDRYLECTSHYLNELSARELWTPQAAGLLLAGMGLLALAGRSRPLIFAWLLIVIGATPMAFVSPRTLAAYYIPVLGYAVFLAVVLVRLREMLVRTRSPIPVLASQSAMFLLLFGTMWRWQVHTERTFPDHWADLERIHSAARQFRARPAWFRPNSSLLIADDPFGEYKWATTFIAAVVGGERSLTIANYSQTNPKPTPEEVSRYTVVIGYKNGEYVEIDRSTLR